MLDISKFDKPEYFINKELSWLQFNQRVLLEARNMENPLFERIKFLSISANNLDEFFMVRVASLYDQIDAKYTRPDESGLVPLEQLRAISEKAHIHMAKQYEIYNKSILPALRNNGLLILKPQDLNAAQKGYILGYFMTEVYPALTPMAVDSTRPFPLILNKSLNIAVLMKENIDDDDDTFFATVQVPSVLPRMVELPCDNANRIFMLLEDVMVMFMDKLFESHHIIATSPYRITRNADLSIEEREAEDMLLEIEKSLKGRKWGAEVRLEIVALCDGRIVKALREALEVWDEDIYVLNGPLSLTFLFKLYSLKGYEHLKFEQVFPHIHPDLATEHDIFDVISRKDIIIHHPFQAFDTVVEFVERAVTDANVLAIKQTLYRISGDSPIVNALEKAAEAGKQVTVLIEVKARFDEENNILWAKRLEKAGCHVLYGLIGLKTHCKITLIIRREEDGIKRYVHLSTGNYNDITAKIYTDIGLFTSNEYFGADASALFNSLSGYSKLPSLSKLIYAPINLRTHLLWLIEREIQNANSGKKAKIIIKANSLSDKDMILALYRASCEGVKIVLIIRGICCLRPAIKGISENIYVKSIIGRFLEHSRIYYFYNSGEEDVYLSSADVMPRNLDRRVELMYPIEEREAKEEVLNILTQNINDNLKSSVLYSDGSYKKIDKRGKVAFSSQQYFTDHAQKLALNHASKGEIVFEPILATKNEQ